MGQTARGIDSISLEASSLGRKIRFLARLHRTCRRLGAGYETLQGATHKPRMEDDDVVALWLSLLWDV